MAIISDALLEYADRLEAAGFTIYDPVSPGSYFRYSRMIDGWECFGYVQVDHLGSGFTHAMPIVPSVKNGSSMWVPNARGKQLSDLSVEAAAAVARPRNANPVVGVQQNYSDPRFEHLYRRRDRSKIEQVDVQ